MLDRAAQMRHLRAYQGNALRAGWPPTGLCICPADAFRKTRLKRADSFYLSQAWRALRGFVLKRDGYRCVVCGLSLAGKGNARVDHIKMRSTHPHLALDPANLRTLCKLHDAQSHREKGSGGPQRDERFVIRGADADGWPIDPGHHWRRG